MALPAPATVDRLARRLRAADYPEWRKKVEATGGCAHPVRLAGHSTITDASSGNILHSTSGAIFSPCGNRRETICPACSDRYAADAFHLLKAGLAGGTKGVPEAVSETPRLFVTLTAPSFGPVHNRRTSHNGKTKPCVCGAFHHEHDPALGQPIDPASYDYLGHVLWQAHAGQLWHRFTIAIRRQLARAAGLRVREFGSYARLSYAKVAEYQRRGVIHFHAVIRVDGPEGPTDPTPAWATAELLEHAIRRAAKAARLRTAASEIGRWELVWGEQIDVRPIRPEHAHEVENEAGEITDDRLPSYVAKYATKTTGAVEGPDRPIRSQLDIDHLRCNDHHRRIIQTAWDLGGLVEFEQLNLRRWAHMLAFRGHFLTKSQRYSTTFKQIRGDRRQYRLEGTLAELSDQYGREITEDTVLVVNHWQMTSIGHRDPEERDLALAIAERIRDQRKRKFNNERKG